MTNARLRFNGVATGSAGSLVDLSLSGSHTNSTTTLTFNAALTYANGTAVPTLANGDYFMLSILDAGGRVAEIVKVTAYTTAGTTATVTRGQEGTSGVSHASGAKVVHAPTAVDINGVRPINAQTGTTYTFVIGDAGEMVTLSNASAITATVPPNSSVAFPIGTVITLCQLGAGQVTVAAGAGVTVRSNPGLKIASQYGVAELFKLATDEWVLYGRTSA